MGLSLAGAGIWSRKSSHAGVRPDGIVSYLLLPLFLVLDECQVMLGFIVSSYMVAEIPGVDATKKPLTLGTGNARSSPPPDGSFSGRASGKDRSGSASGSAADGAEGASGQSVGAGRSRSSGSFSGGGGTPKEALPDAQESSR